VSAPVEPADESAAYLFARANRERRQARSSAAVALYGDLQARHPTSEEAAVSYVSLGWLLLERGAVSDALSQFDHYLGTSPGGLLAPEALFARAQALRAGGQRDEERKTWNVLLARFADSVYASEARRRVEVLR
jgi:TolA-binding protein